MTSTQILLNGIAYLVFGLAPLFVWRSRLNVLWTTQFAFCVTAYVLPLFIIDFNAAYDATTLGLLTEVNFLGAAAMLVGLRAGVHLAPRFRGMSMLFPDLDFVANDPLAERRALMLLLAGVVGMALSFAWMGMTPAFADDPFSAKFFRGEYKAKYDQISILFRFSQFAVITVLPMAMGYALQRRRVYTSVLCVAAMAALALSLTRAPVLEGVVLIVAIAVARRPRWFWVFLIGSTIVYMLGSAVYVLLGLVNSDSSGLEEIAAGAPDILDHLSFLYRFDVRQNLNYGATFVGGLVPGNFHFNPAIYSLEISNPLLDSSDSSSGGFRMPPSIWGYAAYGQVGAALVPFLSGLLAGVGVERLKRLETETRLSAQIAIAIWFKAAWGFFIAFYSMFYFGLLSLLMFVFLTNRRFGRR